MVFQTCYKLLKNTFFQTIYPPILTFFSYVCFSKPIHNKMAKNREVGMASSTHNVLATGTHMKGNISSEEDFRIDGILEGNINCKGKIIIGPNGTINGDIECINIDLLGRVTGNILCHEAVILRSACTLTGEVKTRTIEIEPGATFTGGCVMNE